MSFLSAGQERAVKIAGISQILSLVDELKSLSSNLVSLNDAEVSYLLLEIANKIEDNANFIATGEYSDVTIS